MEKRCSDVSKIGAPERWIKHSLILIVFPLLSFFNVNSVQRLENCHGDPVSNDLRRSRREPLHLHLQGPYQTRKEKKKTKER
jgi:hypothetical protein